MASHPVRIRLIDIREEIAGIRDLTRNATAESFGSSWAMRRAVEHALLIIGEAAKHVPDNLRAKRPEVPWKKIHGLGNMLRHEYHRIDSDILWSVVTENLDGLDKAIEALLGDLPK